MKLRKKIVKTEKRKKGWRERGKRGEGRAGGRGEKERERAIIIFIKF